MAGPEQRVASSAALRSLMRDRATQWLVALAFVVLIVDLVLAVAMGRGPVLAALPWWTPMAESFAFLADLSIAYICFQRYKVRGESAAFVVGLGFWTSAVFEIFYLLTFPGLAGDGAAILGAEPNVAAWMRIYKWAALALLLPLANMVALRPVRRPRAVLAATGLLALAISLLTVRFQGGLPALIVHGRFTEAHLALLAGLALLFGVGIVTALVRYVRDGLPLAAYIAVFQVLAVLILVNDLFGLGRFDLIWYLDRVWLILACSGLLFALLSEYVILYRRVQESAATAEHRAAELEAIVGGMTDALVVAEPQGRILNANPAALQLLGLTRADEAVLTLSDVVEKLQLRYPDGRPIPAQENVMLRALRGETVVGYEGLLRRADGRDVYFSMNTAPVRDARGRVVMAVAVVRDVTELKRLERLRDEFLSTAAHELKTPVTTVKGYVQLMRQWAPQGHEPREAAALEVVNRQCNRLNRLVEELLEVSRLQFGRLELHRQWFDLGELAAEVVERMQATTAKHTLLLRREGVVMVEADRERIDQVLANLLDNAIKFSPKGGEIETSIYRRDGEAVAAVTDHGVGIPADRQARIFERFYRAHVGTRYDYGGMGMGLSISQEIVSRHGGHMWFSSREGTGSTFYFSLPLMERSDNGR